MTTKLKRPKLSRFKYRTAIEWIALNDEPTLTSIDDVNGMVTVVMIADLYGLSPDQVAAEVLVYRARLAEQARRHRAIIERRDAQEAE